LQVVNKALTYTEVFFTYILATKGVSASCN